MLTICNISIFQFLNGRIYLQTSEGLRPAKITFPGADDEKLENISRVSLKTTERFVPCPPARKRRRSAKSISEEPNVKSCSSKSSPGKDNNEDGDKSTLRSKKGLKSSPPKPADPKKPAAKVHATASSAKGKREKRTDKKDAKFEQKTDDDQNEFCPSLDQAEFEDGGNTNEEHVESDLCE